MTTTAEAVREAGLDKFYTIPSISEKCLASIGCCYNWYDWGLVIEPSAGNGSFLTRIPTSKKLGIDISPEHKDIIKQDFLTYCPPSNNGKILVVGNPPFGRVSSLAIKFFNHASKWADVIAFIIPRTFRRVSIHNKLNLNFHLVFDEEIPMKPCSFSPPMMVKCCFQIWEKLETKRSIIKLPTSHEDWEFLGFGTKDIKGQPTPPKGADFAMRAYGGKCGEIVDTGLETLRPKSWHWIKTKINKNTLIERFTALDYTLSLDTARQNSIGKGELVRLYSDAYNKCKPIEIIKQQDATPAPKMEAKVDAKVEPPVKVEMLTLPPPMDKTERVKKLMEHLALLKINHEDQVMKLATLKEAHIYCVIHNISAQQYGSLLEKFIRTKFNYIKNKAKDCNGDCSKDGKNSEVKVSLGGATHTKFNFVQIRPSHDCETYILTAYNLSSDNVESEGKLYIFKVSKEDIKKIIVSFGGYAHGTTKEHGKITIESLNDEKNTKEYALRPTINNACWKALIPFQISEFGL